MAEGLAIDGDPVAVGSAVGHGAKCVPDCRGAGVVRVVLVVWDVVVSGSENVVAVASGVSVVTLEAFVVVSVFVDTVSVVVVMSRASVTVVVLVVLGTVTASALWAVDTADGFAISAPVVVADLEASVVTVVGIPAVADRVVMSW